MSYITPRDEIRLDQKYGGLGATTDVRPGGPWAQVSAYASEMLSRGTVGGGAIRGKTRAQTMGYAQCMTSAVPNVPSGTSAEQAAYMAPFSSYCWQQAQGREPRSTFSPSGPGDGSDNTMLYVGGAVAVVAALGAVYLITK